jgi:hypothetical protein
MSRYAWTLMNGIESGPVMGVASGEGVVIAATSRHNLFRSLDTGRTWRPFPAGAPASPSIHYDAQAKVFYAFADSGLYSAALGAEAWTLVHALKGPPGLNGNLFSAHGRALIMLGGNPVPFEMSLDSGRTWKTPDISTLGINPLSVFTDGSCFYVSDMDTPVMISCDQGKTWRKCAGDSLTHYAYSIQQGKGAVVFAAGWGMFQTADQGKTLKPWGGALSRPDKVWKLRRTGDAFYAWSYNPDAFQRSEDGSTWRVIGMSAGSAGGPEDDAGEITETGGRVFAATGYGVQMSEDTCKTWTGLEFGLMHSPVRAIGAYGARYVAMTADGLYASPDSGGTWKLAFAESPLQQWISFAGEKGLFAAGAAGGYVTVTPDAGRSWSGHFKLPSASPVLSLAAQGGALFAAQPEGFRLSADSGRTWTTMALPGGETPRRLGAGRKSLLIASDTRIWERGPSGALTERGGGLLPLPCIGLWPVDDRLFAAGEDGALRRWDPSAGWVAIPAVKGYANSVVGRGNTLIVSASDGAYGSEDGGSTWTKMMYPPNEEIRSLYVEDRTVYAGDRAGGFWKWTSMLPATPVGIRQPSHGGIGPRTPGLRQWRGRDGTGRKRAGVKGTSLK